MSKIGESGFSAGVLSFMPMFYVGWADSVLSPSEMSFIHQKLQDYTFLSNTDKAFLIQWTDPKKPPTQSEFRIWLQIIKEASQRLDQSKKHDLIEIGLEMAKKGIGYKSEEIWKSPDVLNALYEIKNSLGLNKESEQVLTSRLFPELEISESCDSCSFDHKHLKLLLDGQSVKLKDRVRKLLRDPQFAIQFQTNKEKARARVLKQLKELAAQGLSAYAFPKKYGGFERKGDHMVVFEMLGYGDLSLAIKFGVQFGLFGGAVFELGTESHHKKYLEALHKAELLGCFAMTETGHGSNVKNLETTATYKHNSRSIIINSPNFNSGKEYIGNALHSNIAAVFAQLIVNGINHGVHAIMVPIRDKSGQLLTGVKCEDNGYKMGLNGVDNGRLWFNNIEVPVENLLDKYGSIDGEGNYHSPISNPAKRFFTMLGALVVGRICVGLLGVNASKVALTIALKYAFKRRQFAPKEGHKETLIIDYPTHQKRLLPLLAKTYVYSFALDDLAQKYTHANADSMREIETLAAGLKSKATWHCTHTVQTCREACGGKAYLAKNRFASLKADSDIFTTFEGDNTVLMQLVAKGLLTNFKQTFHDDGYRAVIRFLLTKVKHEAYENNPIFKRNTDSEHLLDKNFHFHAFNYRKRKTLISLSDRMRKYLRRGVDPFQAFLRVQIHTIDLAGAFIDQVCLKSFYNRLEQCEDSDTKKALSKLGQLYGLETIIEHKGWYLENDYIDGSKTKAIRRVISKLYKEIKPDVLGFIDAFAIPEELISAPIALIDES